MGIYDNLICAIIKKWQRSKKRKWQKMWPKMIISPSVILQLIYPYFAIMIDKLLTNFRQIQLMNFIFPLIGQYNKFLTKKSVKLPRIEDLLFWRRIYNTVLSLPKLGRSPIALTYKKLKLKCGWSAEISLPVICFVVAEN